MGMDSYLYKTSKSEYSKYKEYKKNYEENHIKYENEYKEYKKYLEETFNINWENLKCKEDFVAIIGEDNYKKWLELFHKLDGYSYDYKDFTPEELYYWRKPWGMHSYIRDNFLADGEDDNCNRIPLSLDNLNQMVKEMERCLNNYGVRSPNNPFGEDNYWDDEDLKYAIEVFKDVIKSYDEDTVIYYYSWY